MVSRMGSLLRLGDWRVARGCHRERLYLRADSSAPTSSNSSDIKYFVFRQSFNIRNYVRSFGVEEVQA